MAYIILFSLATTLFFTLALSLHTPNNCNNAPNPQGSTLQLINVNSPCSPFGPKTHLSWPDTVLQMQSNDRARLQYLSSLLVAAGRRVIVPIAYGRAITQNSTYIVRAKIGTPPQTLFVALDTANDAAWVPCAGCVGCSNTTYNPFKSTTSKAVGCRAPQCNQVPNPNPKCKGAAACGFKMMYGGSTIAASLVQDTITLANDAISGYTFGCIQKVTGTSVPAQGLMGLGRGPLSLLSQTPSLYQFTFSYCLPNYKSSNFSGWLRLGPNSQPSKIIGTTPLLQSPRRSSLYYVNLVGIRVGRKVLNNIPYNAFYI